MQNHTRRKDCWKIFLGCFEHILLDSLHLHHTQVPLTFIIHHMGLGFMSHRIQNILLQLSSSPNDIESTSPSKFNLEQNVHLDIFIISQLSMMLLLMQIPTSMMSLWLTFWSCETGAIMLLLPLMSHTASICTQCSKRNKNCTALHSIVMYRSVLHNWLQCR